MLERGECGLPQITSMTRSFKHFLTLPRSITELLLKLDRRNWNFKRSEILDIQMLRCGPNHYASDAGWIKLMQKYCEQVF